MYPHTNVTNIFERVRKKNLSQTKKLFPSRVKLLTLKMISKNMKKKFQYPRDIVLKMFNHIFMHVH